MLKWWFYGRCMLKLGTLNKKIPHKIFLLEYLLHVVDVHRTYSNILEKQKYLKKFSFESKKLSAEGKNKNICISLVFCR